MTALTDTGKVVPFRPRYSSRRDRVIVFAIRAGDLKQAVMDAYLDHLIDTRQVQDVFTAYGLCHD
jgi:hypothetical protein